MKTVGTAEAVEPLRSGLGGGVTVGGGPPGAVVPAVPPEPEAVAPAVPPEPRAVGSACHHEESDQDMVTNGTGKGRGRLHKSN